MNDLYRPQLAKDVARKPHLAISADADPPQKLIIGNEILADKLWCPTGLRSPNVAVQQWDWRMHVGKLYNASVAVTIGKSRPESPICRNNPIGASLDRLEANCAFALLGLMHAHFSPLFYHHSRRRFKVSRRVQECVPAMRRRHRWWSGVNTRGCKLCRGH